MKNKLKYLLLTVVLISVFSCEDYLETPSKSTFTEDLVFSNLDFASKAVYGIYDNLASYWLYTYHMGLFWKCDNDIEVVISSDDGSKKSLAHYAGTEGSKGLKEVWETLYQSIERANICIDNLPVSPVWEGEYADEAKRLYGEAVTLRAMLYYELISLWGDVPFKIKSTQAGDDYYSPKTDRDEIYEYLIQDLKDVEEYVPWMTSTAERVNKAFVKGLRARLALAYSGYSLRNVTHETKRGRNWEEYYQIANQECREIMESGRHQLNNSFENVFKTLHNYQQETTYKEVLFEIAYGRLYSGRVAYSIGMKYRRNDKIHGKAAGEICVAPNYFYTFDANDERRNVSVELFNYNNSKFVGKQRLVSKDKANSFQPTKWRRGWINPGMGGDLSSTSYTGVNWPIMRYSDILLMFAESENQINGPTPAAQNALAMVRQRAFSEDVWPEKVSAYVQEVSANKESFFDAIVDERAWEFGGEMLRKYDLVRWNLLGEKIQEMKDMATKIINNDPEYDFVPDYIFWRYKEDNATLEILNQDYRIEESEVEGWERSSWIPKSSSSKIPKYIEDLDLVAHGYDPAKNNHLFHIHSDIIAASNGVLENDQIP